MKTPSDDELTENNTDFGSLLAEARKAKNYTVDEVSDYLKIPVRTITALEANDNESLPAPTFTQGYIRAYAKFLEISEDEVLDIYNHVMPRDDASHLKPRSTLPDEANSQSPLIKTITMLLILAVIAAIAVGGFQYYQEKAGVLEDALDAKQQSFTGNSLDDPGTHRLDIKQKIAVSENSMPATEMPAPENKPAETAENDEADAPAAITPGETATASADLIEEKSESAPAEITSDAGSMQDTIEIIAENGSWVEVRDANKSRLLYNMLPAGGSRELAGRAPFSVTMGNARTTRVIVNGIEVDVSDYIRSTNTASFKVSTEGQEIIFH